MNIVERLFSGTINKAVSAALDEYKAQQPKYPPWALATAQAESYMVEDGHVFDRQISLYHRVRWVNAALDIYGDLCASVALNVKTVNGEKEDDVPNHPFELLLDDPNPLMSRAEFLKATFCFLRLTGNCYWWLNVVSKEPAEIWVLPPNSVTPVPDGNLFIKGYNYDPGNGNVYLLPPEQIVHFKAFNPSSLFVGMGKGEPLALTAETDNAMVQYNRNYFGKNNAKLAGAIAFKDMIDNTQFETLRKDIKEQWGGVNRNGPMVMRGVGDGVNWIQMGTTQDEMQFLESRQLSREEIWSVLAPGLASMLSISATEANAKTGKATLIDLAMWPAMVAVAQRITKSVLPLYAGDGGKLRCEFDDIRVTDRVLEIQEIDQYAKFHTIKEVRENKFKDKALNDERDDLLVVQVTDKSGLDVPEPAQPIPGSVPPELQNANDNANQDNTPPAQLPDTAPQQPADMPAMAELDQWQRKASKRLKEHGNADCEFKASHIGEAEQARIHEALKACKTVEDVKAVFSEKPPLIDIMFEMQRAMNYLEAHA